MWKETKGRGGKVSMYNRIKYLIIIIKNNNENEIMKEETERLQMPEWIDDTRRTSFSKSTKQGKYELTKTEAANTGPSWICAKSSTIYYNCGFNILWGS